MELVTPGIGLIFWMTLSFSLLLYILTKYAWKPIMNALKERENSIEHALQSANEAKIEIEKLKQTNNDMLKQAKIEREGILRDARLIKESIIKEAQLKANEEATRIIENAKAGIVHEKMLAITELKNQVALLSIEIAEKIIKQELNNKDKQQKYIEDILDNLNLN